MPPRAPSADKAAKPQSPNDLARAIEDFFAEHPSAAILEDGKALFDLATAKHTLTTDHDRCTLQLWSDDRNMVRRIVSATPRATSLRLDTLRFGHTQTKLLELVPSRETRTPTTRDTARKRFIRILERVLERHFAPWRPEAFRSAMDLERSFGPAYARGSLVRGTQAWAVIAANEEESAVTIDGILTVGLLWLHHCRERAGGRRLYQGLKVIVPRGTATLTLARMAWLNPNAAQWQLWELDQTTEELTERDPSDQGNLRTRLIHHPDPHAAADRFAGAITHVLDLVPSAEQHRVEQRLRSTSELAFLLHGLEFARARIGLAPNSFARTLDLTVGVGSAETPLTPATRDQLSTLVAELFARRRVSPPATDFGRHASSSSQRIGSAALTAPAHARIRRGAAAPAATRPATLPPTQDPLFRAAPERWLESVLRQDLASLTRSLAPAAHSSPGSHLPSAIHDDPDTIGNRADPSPSQNAQTTNIIPRLDPLHVYTQVPAIAGSTDRGLLDLLGVTADGRLAVIELKAEDDLHFALQGLDYWIRVRHHHAQAPDALTGMGEFQRHGYFRGVELAPAPASPLSRRPRPAHPPRHRNRPPLSLSRRRVASVGAG